MSSKLVRPVIAFLAFTFCVFQICGADAPADSSFLKLWGREPSAETARGYDLIDSGSLDEAESAFSAALKKDANEAAALSGLGKLAAVKCDFQGSLEYRCKAALAAGTSPLAEIEVEIASELLLYCKDPSPFMKLLDEKSPLSPNVRDAARTCAIDWLINSGKYDEAAKLSSALGHVTKFMLIGPFDNRDKAGFATAQAPDKEIDFEKLCDGRNRKVGWHGFDSELLDGRIWLSDLYEPNIHVSSYAVTLFKSEKSGEAVLRAGCAGALKMWFNGQLVGTLDEYNDFGDNKLSAVVPVRAGWNLVMLKSAVEEETQWGFSLRVCDVKGGPLAGVTFDASKTALDEWRKEQKGITPDAPSGLAKDDRLPSVLRKYVSGNPNDARALACYAGLMDSHKLGEAKNSSSDAPSPEKYLRAAIALAPKNPLYKIQLANEADDNNEARAAIEAVNKTHSTLPATLETLVLLADKSRMQIQSEDLARKALKLNGIERCGASALVLARVMSTKNERAEAWRILTKFNEAFPYHAAAWAQRIDWEDSAVGHRQALEKALLTCAGDRTLIYKQIDSLNQLGKHLDAARLAATTLRSSPNSTAMVRYAANEYLRAGYIENARKIVDNALRNMPEQPELLALSAQLRHRAGRPGEAVALLKQALAIKPNSPEYKDYLALLDAGKTLDREFFAPYDIALKDIPVPNAADYPKDNAVKMLNQEIVRVNPNGSTSRMQHLVAKVLRPAGVRELMYHNIYYEPGRQTVDILRAAVITPDGRELSRASIHDRSTSAAAGVESLIYDEHHLKQISFSDLEPGSIIDLQYTIRDNGDNIYGDYFADSFYFNDGQPSQRAQYVLDYPKTLAVQTKTHNTNSPAERMDSKDPGREVVKWELKNTPGVLQEHAMPPVVNSLPQLQVTTMKSWQEVGQWYWNLARDQVVVNDEMRKEIAVITKDCKTDTDKLRAIHDWVIRKIRYLGIEFGRNGYKPHKAIESYKSLYGDCKDTATLITAMLRSINIDSRLVLIRTVNAGAIAPDSLPMPNLFNHCIAYVPNVDGKSYWIDGTTDFFRLGEVPSADRSANVLVSGPEGGEFKTIPQSAAADNLIEQIFDVNVSKSGAAKVALRDTRVGQFAPVLRESIETPGRFERSMKEYVARKFNGAELKKIKSSDPLEQGPAWSEIEMDVPRLGSISGEQMALPGSFEQLNLTQRYAPDAKRVNDIQFYTPWSRKTVIHYKLEAGAKFSSLPKEERLELPHGRFVRTVKVEGTDLQIDELLELPSTRIPANDYEAFKNLCQRVDELQDQKVLIQY